MNGIREPLVHYHKEFHPAQQILFEIIACVLKRFEPILRKGISHICEIERYTLIIPDLPENLSGARIVHISDMHFHESWEPDKMANELLVKLRVAKQEAGTSPVVCVFTGDILSKHTNFSLVQPYIIRFMNGFRSIFGPRAILRTCEGNHDVHRKYWAEEKKALEQIGFDYSEASNYGGIHITTTPDFTVDTGAREMLQARLQAPSKNLCLRLILSHNPDVARNMAFPRSYIPQLIMSGHTHNGHIGIISDKFFAEESDIIRRLAAFILLGHRSPLVAGVQSLVPNVFISISSGVGENENRPRINSPRSLPVFELRNS